MTKSFTIGIIIIVLVIIFSAIMVWWPITINYPVKVLGFNRFLAGISQIIKLDSGQRVEVSIAEQKMRTYEGNKLINEFSVSTGAKDSPTPTGNFTVYTKFVMVYSRGADCWIPFWVGFTIDGFYGFHEVPICKEGRRGLADIGKPASLGCVRLNTQDSETFYKWVRVGAQITIK